MKISESEVLVHEAAETEEPQSAQPAENFVPPGQRIAPWWHTALIVLLLLGMSFGSSLQAGKGKFAVHHVPQYLATIGYEWFLLGVVWIGLRLKRVPMRTLLGVPHRGWKGLGRDLAVAGIFWVMAMAVIGCLSVLIFLFHRASAAAPQSLTAIAPRNALDLFIWFVLCISAGICEEILFRGYLVRQFTLRGKAWIGVVISSLIFGASHGYEGWPRMLALSVLGALLCLLYLKSRSLRPGMIVHAWQDIFAGLLLMGAAHFHMLPK